MLQKHDNDLYRGNGKPGLTTRMELCEERLRIVNNAAEEIRKDSRTIKLMVIGAILTIMGDILVKVLVK
jgi:hypothetical protein